MMKNGTLLLYRYGGIGDTMTLAPFLAGVRYAYDRIVLVGLADRLRLLPESLFHEALSFDLVRRDLPRLLSGARMSVAFTMDPKRLAPAKFQITFPPFPEDDENLYDYHARLAPLAGGKLVKFSPPDHQGKGVLIHPGAGGPTKRADGRRLAEAALAEPGQGEIPAILLGPAEEDEAAREVIEALASRFTHDTIPILRPDTPGDLKSVILRHRVFVGNDSGPAHIAALHGLETRIFSRSGERWRPPGRGVRIIPIG